MDVAMNRMARWDAPFWAFLLVGLFSFGALGCFGVAVAQVTSHQPDVEILLPDAIPPPADL